jgi:hypothetical protein
MLTWAAMSLSIGQPYQALGGKSIPISHTEKVLAAEV